MAKLKQNKSGRGGHSGHTVSSTGEIDGTALDQIETFDTFGCDVPIENPETLQRVTPNKRFVRKFFGGQLTMPDGRDVDIWSFEDEKGRESFPAPSIVVNQGDVVHTTLKSSKNSHTIHHHGIEPTSFNDGVGHTSFEVTGDYTYQFRATECGTFFYHCHKNTVLHAEMGMYGPLIVLPRDHVRPPGSGFKFNAFAPMAIDVPQDVFERTSFHTQDELRAYDVEFSLLADEIDPRWHELNHNAGLCGEDAGLNNFNPKYFLINGVPFFQNGLQSTPFIQDRADRSLVEFRAKVGQTVLFRFAHAGYSVLNISQPLIRGLPSGLDELEIVVIEDTGRQLGGQHSPYSRPFLIPLSEGARAAGLPITPARRNTVLIRQKTPHAERYDFPFIFLHWITGRPQGIAIPALIFEP